MAHQPEDRYASPRAAGRRRRAVDGRRAGGRRREPAAARLSRWARRHRSLVTGAAALLIASTLGLASGTASPLGQANALAEVGRLDAERNHEMARNDVDRFFTVERGSPLDRAAHGAAAHGSLDHRARVLR